MEQKSKRELIIEDRLSGMTCEQVAKKYGVSKQRVAQVCAGLLSHRFTFITETGCVYPVIREWLNNRRVSCSELCRRMGVTSHEQNVDRVKRLLNGKAEFRKHDIDSLIKITGMSYEELFHAQ